MATPSLSYLLLDSQNDPVFIPSVALTGTDAVAQDILTRLNLWQGEWWENLSLGLPVFQSMLGQLGSSANQQAMSLVIQQQIMQAPFVLNVLNVEASFSNGIFSFTCTVQTQFGTITVSNTPGAAAA